MADIINIEEFVSKPSEITKHLIKIVVRLNSKYESLLKAKSIIKKFKIDFKIKMYLKAGYMDFYSFLKEYKVPNYNLHGVRKLELLFEEFERLYDKLFFNNLALAHTYVTTKEMSNVIFTMEDKKVLFFKKLSHNEITMEQFIKEFGHYALNAYELSSRRFEEYSYQELVSIAQLVSNFKIREKIPLEEYMNSNSKKEIAVLIALRELAKYNILFLIRDIRYELLQLARDNGIQNIFNKSYEEITELGRSRN